MNISYDSYRVFYYAAKYKSFSRAAARSIITNQMLPESSSDWNLNCIAALIFSFITGSTPNAGG